MDGVSLRLYQPTEGCPAVCRIVDTKGQTVNTITAVKNGDEITISLAQPAGEIALSIYLGKKVQEEVITAGAQSVKVTLK